MHRTSLFSSMPVALIFAAAALSCDANPTGSLPPVDSVPVASVTVAPSATTLTTGQSVALSAIAKDADGKELINRPVTWTSNAEGVATVSAAGVVQAHSVGPATITATSEGKKATATITVSAVAVARVGLSATTVALAWDGAQQLTATAFDADDNVLEGRVVTWTTGNATIATVSAAGLVEAQDEGLTQVWATIEGKQAHAVVEVDRPPVARVVIAPASLALESGEGTQLSVSLEDPRGRPLLGRAVVWASNDQAVAFVTGSGMVHALQVGRATVTATSEGVSGGLLVEVAPVPSYDLIYDRPLTWPESEIFTLGLTAGAAPVRMNAGDVSRRPSPSPDGSRFVFAASYHHPTTGMWVHDLFIVDRNGMNMRQLTNWAGTETDPVWSPDGERIAFTGINIQSGRSDVFVINVDGTGLVNLTAGINDISHAMQPSWSHDGARLALVVVVGTVSAQSRIWTMRADGSEAAPIETDWPGFDQYPTWSPAGDRVAFQRYFATEGRAGLVIAPVAGGPAVRLELPGQQFQPAWSSDGEYLAFALRITDNTVRTELYTVRPDGTGLRLRTTDPNWGGGANPQWINRR